MLPVLDQSFSERTAAAARRWQMEPWLFFTSGDKINRRKWQNVRNKRYSALRLRGLPRHVHILTLEPWKAGSVLLRLENTLEWPNPSRDRSNTDRPEVTKDIKSHITVDLRKIFLQHQIRTVRETTLAANQWLDDARQMDWSTRYVYNGSDDGIMSEDNIEDEDNSGKPIDTKDSANYSEEEQEYSRKILNPPRQKYSDKGRVRTRSQTGYEEYGRRKRSPNTTDDIIENIIVINETNDDKAVVINKNTNPSITSTSSTQMTNLEAFQTEKSTNIHRVPAMSRRASKLSILNKPKTETFANWETGAEEITSSEEDFSSNMKKRSSRRKSATKRPKIIRPEIIVDDDADEVVTKSIYDMYYRVKPKIPFKYSIRNSKEVKNRREKNRRNTKTYDYDDIKQTTVNYRTKYRNKRRGKRRGLTVDMPFFITENRRNRKSREDKLNRRAWDNLENTSEESQIKGRTTRNIEKSLPVISNSEHRHEPLQHTASYEDEELIEDDAESTEEKMEYNRKKRTIPKDDQAQAEPNYSDPEQNEPDYVITLRPTQIRTFVIWFESNKKSYVT